MIDAFNEIKKEEKENRKKLKNRNEKSKNDLNQLFTKNVKNEIKAFGDNISFKNNKNSFDSDKNKDDDTLLINQNSISIYYKQLIDEDKDKNDLNLDSFITNQTNGSISNILNVLNDNKIYTKDLPNILEKSNYKAKKTKKTKKGNDIKTNKVNKKVQKKETNHNSIKIFNNILNKDENYNQSLKNTQIKNDSQIKNKKITDKNILNKYAVTSSNVTNSSSIISKKIKNHQTSSSPKKNSKENNKENNNSKNNKEKIIEISKVNKINTNNNMYQKTSPSPNINKFGLKKNFYKTNNNFNKKSSLNNIIEKNIKENIQKNKNDNNPKKEKCQINKEVVKKKYIKSKHISQDFDSNLVYKMTENILNNKINYINSNSNSNSKQNINTENNRFKTFKNYLSNDNPNLITRDTKSNERNEKILWKIKFKLMLEI